MVYYRKYRPQKISELDLVSVRERLASILKASLKEPPLSAASPGKRTPSQAQSVPHAFLFTGPKGLGKTSAARILAKAINCKNYESRIKNQEKTKKENEHDSKFIIHDSDSFEPCNECDACVSITNGSNIDVLEIDAASNRGIDEIRELRDKIKFAPSNLSKKVYIIDEVHMLTNEAFNALLKTLEEPPSHAIFILCTTEAWKVPQTIISRAFHVTFEKPTMEEMLSSFARILVGEKIEFEQGVLEEVYKLADGAFRNGAKILEELVLASGGKKLTKEILEKTFKTKNVDENVRLFVESMAAKNAKEAFTILNNLANEGNDFSFVTEKIVECLRLQMFAKSGVGESSDELNLNISEIENLLEMILESYKQLKYTILPQMPLELVVAKWCVNGTQNSELRTQKENQDEKNTSLNEEKLEHKEDGEKVQSSESKIQNDGLGEKKDERVEVGDESLNKQISPAPQGKEFGELFDPNSKTFNFFTTLVERVKKDNHSIAGILRGCKLADMGNEKVTLETKFKFHKDKLMEEKARKILDLRASEIMRKNIVIEIVLKE